MKTRRTNRRLDHDCLTAILEANASGEGAAIYGWSGSLWLVPAVKRLEKQGLVKNKGFNNYWAIMR